MSDSLEFVEPGLPITIAEALPNAGWEIESVTMNGVAYDFENNPTFTPESGQSYEIVIVLPYAY